MRTSLCRDSFYRGSTVLAFAFGLLCWEDKNRYGFFKGKSVCWHTNLKLSLFQAKCNVGLVYELINEIKQALSLARSRGNQQAALSFKEFAQMLSENVQVLDQYPECTLQQSANFPDSSAPAKAAQVNNVQCSLLTDSFNHAMFAPHKEIQDCWILESTPWILDSRY